MKLERTTDINKINSVLKHDYIWPRVSDKRQDKEAWAPQLDGVHYLFADGILFILHVNGDGYQIHANVLPDSRERAEEAAGEALRYGFEELKAKKITAEIPKEYGSVYGFSLKFMKDVGFTNGNHLMALRVEEWDL